MPETQGSNKPFGVLDRIVETKWAEIENLLPRDAVFQEEIRNAPVPRDFLGALNRPGEVGLIAEVKRRSPGAGPIRPDLDPTRLAKEYQAAGAAAISVLTDREYFGGSLDDLRAVKAAVDLPVFRKDFVLHRIQLSEARAAGADGVLLIARILSPEALRTLHAEAVGLGLSVLVEVHGAHEVENAVDAGARLIGVNNRNLQTFSSSLDVTLELLPLIPTDVAVVSESGIRTSAEVDRLGSFGVQGILVGETLLRSYDPEAMARNLARRPRVARKDSGASGSREDRE